MRVSANPSPKMQALLTEVKNWAISYKIGFYQVGEGKAIAAGQIKDILMKDAQTLCNYVDAEEGIENDNDKQEKMGIKFTK